jgi:hypothetical protein
MAYLDNSTPEARRMRLIVGSLSVLATGLVAVGFLVSSRWSDVPPDERIIFVNSWGMNRTRQDTLNDRAADQARLAAKLAESRAYIASLPPQDRQAAQAQYDRYVAAPPSKRFDTSITGFRPGTVDGR